MAFTITLSLCILSSPASAEEAATSAVERKHIKEEHIKEEDEISRGLEASVVAKTDLDDGDAEVVMPKHEHDGEDSSCE